MQQFLDGDIDVDALQEDEDGFVLADSTDASSTFKSYKREIDVTKCTPSTNYTAWLAYYSAFKVVLYFMLTVTCFSLSNAAKLERQSSLACSSRDESNMRSVFLGIAVVALIQCVLELFSLLSGFFFGSLYRTDFEYLTFSQNLYLLCYKCLPGPLMVLHLIGLAIILWGWLTYTTAIDCRNVSSASTSTSLFSRFEQVLIVATCGWTLFLFMGYLMRSRFPQNIAIAYPLNEVDPNCFGTDLTCEDLEKQSKPRFLHKTYMHGVRKHKWWTSTVRYIGESGYRFYRGVGSLLLFVKSHRNEIAP